MKRSYLKEWSWWLVAILMTIMGILYALGIWYKCTRKEVSAMGMPSGFEHRGDRQKRRGGFESLGFRENKK